MSGKSCNFVAMMTNDDKNSLLTRTECQAMKGLAILSIMLHNLCHLMPVARGTNEFAFSEHAASNLWDYLQHIDGNWFLVLGAFFGQFGVQVFLFLSAYGLVRKYEQGRGVGVGHREFISEHYWKLFRLMIIGLVIAVFLGELMKRDGGWFLNTYLGMHGFKMHFMSRPEYWIPQTFMITNLLPHPDVNIWPGPFWFLGIMVQLYIVYRIFLYATPQSPAWRRWLPVLLFLAVTLVPQYLVPHTGEAITYLRYNFLIAGVPFAAGLLAARYVRRPVITGKVALAATFALSTAAFIAMQFDFTLWLWCPIFFVLAVASLVRLAGERLMKPIVWVGVISSALFIVHPIVRIFFFTWDWCPASCDHLYLVLLVYAAVSILAAVGYRRLIAYLPSPKKVTQYR